MRNETIIDKLGVPLMSKILIKVEDTSSEFKTKGGIIAKSDVNPDAWADSEGHNLTNFLPRHGEVIKMPRSVNSHGWDYFTDVEIQVGDTVYWSIIGFEDMTVLVCAGNTYLQVDYHRLLIRVRDGKITPINGNVLLTPVPIETKALAYTMTSKLSDRWDIFQLPEKIPVSKIPRRNGETNWEIGDRVILLVNRAAIKIEGDINKSLDNELFCIPNWMILANVKQE